MKRKIKVIITSLLSVFTILTSFSSNLINISAAEVSIVHLEATGYTHTGQAWNPNKPGYSSWFNGQSIDRIYLSDGKIGFCVEPWTIVGDKTGYNSIDQYNATYSKIIYHGYLNTSQSLYDYAVVQLMIWEQLGYAPKTNVPNYGTRKAEIQSAINTHDTKPSFHGNSYEMNLGESLTITDTNNVVSQFSNWSATGCDIKVNGNTLTITPSMDTFDTITIAADKYVERNLGASYIYKHGSSQQIYSGMLIDSVTMRIQLKVNKFGSLEIGKQDEDGMVVPNTSFKLSYNADMSDPIGTYTTGVNGKVTIGQLLPKQVYYQEVSVPAHLILDSTIKNITILPNQTVYVSAVNKWKEGKIELTKKDHENGKVIISSPATISIYKEDGSFITDLTTVNGKTSAYTLRYGKYYYLEKATPNNYDIDNTKHFFEITLHGVTVSETLLDKRTKVSLELVKEDAETGNIAQGDATLDGAVYGLYARENILDPADNTIIYHKNEKIEQVTITNAKASLSNLYTGKYYWKEITPPKGYTLNEKEYDVDATYTSAMATITKSTTVKDEVIKGKHQIFKTSTDGTSGILQPLANVEFTYKLLSEVNAVGWDNAFTYDVITTNALGMATTKDLPYGKYLVKETKTPDGKIPAPDFTITISENNKTYFNAINNAPFKSYVKMVKQDEKGNHVVLDNATFQIKDGKGNIVKQKVGDKYIDEFTTNEKGYVVTPLMLEAGIYTIDEIKTPKGFLKLETPVQFEITNRYDYDMDIDNDPIITIKIKNEKPTAEIIINKSFENPQDNALGGAEFKLTANSVIIDPATGKVIYNKGDEVNVNGAVDGLYTVNESGALTISNLPMSEGSASYKMVEVSTLDGYVLDTSEYIFTFTQENLTQKVYTQTKDIENKQTTTQIIKDDVDGKAVVGAEMALLDEKGNVVEQWITTKDAYIIKGLIVGQKYTIRELSAPVTYVIAKDVTFTIKNTTDTQKYTMSDKQVSVLKTNADTGKGLAGAEFVVTSTKTKQIVDQWTSTEEAHFVNHLVEGLEYTITEITAPTGFKKSEPITFIVSADKETQVITVENKPISISTTAFNAETLEKYFDAFGEITVTDKVEYKALNVGQEYKMLGVIMDKATKQPLVIDGKEVTSETTFTPKEENGYVEVSFTFSAKGLDAKELVVFEELKITSDEEMITVAEHKDIDDKDQTVKVRRAANIQVNKVNSVTNESIKDKDFAFTIFSDATCMEKVDTVRADTETGTALFENVKEGVWYIKETAAPLGYRLSDEVVKVEVNDKGVFINDKETDKTGDVYCFNYENKRIPVISAGDITNKVILVGLILLSGLSFLLLLCKLKKEIK